MIDRIENFLASESRETNPRLTETVRPTCFAQGIYLIRRR